MGCEEEEADSTKAGHCATVNTEVFAIHHITGLGNTELCLWAKLKIRFCGSQKQLTESGTYLTLYCLWNLCKMYP